MKAYIPSWEYIAGFYDGEGCFRIYPYKNTNPNGYTYTGERPFVVDHRLKITIKFYILFPINLRTVI